MCLYVNISKYTPLKVSSYIDLPKSLKDKKANVNVQNTDQQCLKWALLYFQNPAWKDAQRVTKYIARQDELDFTGIEFPTPLNQIPNVERHGLAINVFGYSESAGIHPLYLTKDHNREPINLLLITEVNEGKTNSHYCWIKNFDRLCHSQTKYEHRKFFCLRCISSHSSERTLQDHMIYCGGVDAPPSHAVFPEVDKDGIPPSIKFKKYPAHDESPIRRLR